MAILAPPDSPRRWQHLVEWEAQTGQIPLPVLDTLLLDPARRQITALALVSRTLEPHASHVQVRHDQMAPEDAVLVHGLLNAIEQVSECRPLARVYHLGGLDFVIAGPEREVSTAEMDEEKQMTLWALLRALALVAEQYPDRSASLPRKVHVAH